MTAAFDHADIAVSYSELISEELIEELASALRSCGLTVVTEAHEETPQASLEWVLPTAIVVFLTQKYVGTLVQEAAKEHYPAIKRALARLVRRTTGPSREVRLEIVSSSPAKHPGGEIPVLSVYTQLRSGRRVKFLFENPLQDAEVEGALDLLISLLVEHQTGLGADTLSQAECESPGRSWVPVIIRFNSITGSWEAARLSFPPPKPTGGAA